MRVFNETASRSTVNELRFLPCSSIAGANTHYGVSPPSWVVRPQTGLPAEAGGDALTLVYGDIASHDVVSSLLEGCVAVVHTTVFFPQQLPGVRTTRSTPSLCHHRRRHHHHLLPVAAQVHDGVVLPDAIADDTWRVNLKGLWNLLDVAQRSETVERVVHVGERPRLLHVLELCSDPSPRCRPPRTGGNSRMAYRSRSWRNLRSCS